MVESYLDDPRIRPCLVLAHGNSAYAASAAHAFRLRGWDVYLARSGPETRRLVRMLSADLVILDAQLPEESGWLTCAKLAGEQPLMEIVLVAEASTPILHRLAAFVGAHLLVDERPDAAGLVDAVASAPLTAAG